MQKVPWLGKEATRKQFLKGIGQSEANAAAEKRTNKKETRRRKMLVYFVKRFYSFRVDLLTVTRPSHAKKVRLLCTSEPLIWNCHRLRFLYPELNKSVLQSSEHQQQHAAGRSLPRTLELLAPHCRPWPWHIVAHWTGHGHGTLDHSPPGAVLELHRHPEVATPVVPGPGSVPCQASQASQASHYQTSESSSPNLDIIRIH